MGNLKKIIYVIALIIGIIVIIAWIGVSMKEFKEEENASDIAKIEIQWDVSWDENDGNIYYNTDYNLYIPSIIEASDLQNLILFIHGGSWSSGSKEEMDYFCKAFAKQGYITATMDYSLISSENDVTMETMLDDISEVLSEILIDSASKGYSIKSGALVGYSAGAELALLYSYEKADSSAIPLKFVASMAGPTDFHEESWTNYDMESVIFNLSHLAGISVTEDNLSSKEVKNAMNKISPVYYVDGNSLPTVMLYSDSDETVLPIHYEKLTEALKENEVTYTLIKATNTGHYVFQDMNALEDFVNEILEYAKKYF